MTAFVKHYSLPIKHFQSANPPSDAVASLPTLLPTLEENRSTLLQSDAMPTILKLARGEKLNRRFKRVPYFTA